MAINVRDMRNSNGTPETGPFEPVPSSSRGVGLYSEVCWNTVGSRRPAAERTRTDGDRPRPLG